MPSVYARQVQDVDRIGCLHRLRSREVFHNRRGHGEFDVHRLSHKLQLACGELSSGKLHLQFGLFGA
jgi:hypothetical protein